MNYTVVSEPKVPLVLTTDNTTETSIPDELTQGDVEDMLIKAWEEIALLREQLRLLRQRVQRGT